MITKISADLSEYRINKSKDLLIQAKLLHNTIKNMMVVLIDHTMQFLIQ